MLHGWENFFIVAGTAGAGVMLSVYLFTPMMLHYAVRGVMHEAAIKADIDPDQLSFIHAVRVIRRRFSTSGAFPPSPENILA